MLSDAVCDIIAEVIGLIMQDELIPARLQPIPQNTSVLTGELYTTELLNNPSEAAFRVAARMSKSCFMKLCDFLKVHGGLTASRRISIEEMVLMEMECLQGLSDRKVGARFQHSTSTVSDVIHKVTESIMNCCESLWVMAKPHQVDPVFDEPKYAFFRNCIGALDGTHVAAATNNPLYRNRKGFMSTNVLAVANFDMTFQFVHVGWEGSAHDCRVLRDAYNKGFAQHQGKYYLGDGGYSLTERVLTPYRGVRYHLKEWHGGNRSPQNKEELFNLRHASKRNVVERIFGVVQKRFPILKNMPAYSLPMQSDLALTCFALHNFIHQNQNDDEFDAWNEDEAAAVEPEMYPVQDVVALPALAAFRNDIAQAMWTQYQEQIAQHD